MTNAEIASEMMKALVRIPGVTVSDVSLGGESPSFTRLLIENRVSRGNAETAYRHRRGAQLRQQGMKCGCSECSAAKDAG
jgi:hypothetical protein